MPEKFPMARSVAAGGICHWLVRDVALMWVCRSRPFYLSICIIAQKEAESMLKHFGAFCFCEIVCAFTPRVLNGVPNVLGLWWRRIRFCNKLTVWWNPSLKSRQKCNILIILCYNTNVLLSISLLLVLKAKILLPGAFALGVGLYYKAVVSQLNCNGNKNSQLTMHL